MKLLTANLEKKALDWALAKVLGAQKITYSYKGVWVDDEGFMVGNDRRGWIAHTDPAVCLWLIKAYHLPVFVYQEINGDGCLWQVNFSDDEVNAESWRSLEEAVARCVVAMRLGDEVEVPSELCEVRS